VHRPLSTLFPYTTLFRSNQGEVHSIDRNISDLEVYGKYKDESHYKAIVTLNLTFDHKDKTDNAFTIVQVDLTKKENTWLIDNFRSEEHTSELQSRFDLVC